MISKNAEAAAGPLIFGRRPTAKTAQLMGVNATNPRTKRSGKGSLSQPSGPTGSKRSAHRQHVRRQRRRPNETPYCGIRSDQHPTEVQTPIGGRRPRAVDSAWLDSVGYQFDDVNRFHPNLYRPTRTYSTAAWAEDRLTASDVHRDRCENYFVRASNKSGRKTQCGTVDIDLDHSCDCVLSAAIRSKHWIGRERVSVVGGLPQYGREDYHRHQDPTSDVRVRRITEYVDGSLACGGRSVSEGLRTPSCGRARLRSSPSPCTRRPVVVRATTSYAQRPRPLWCGLGPTSMTMASSSTAMTLPPAEIGYNDPRHAGVMFSRVISAGHGIEGAEETAELASPRVERLIVDTPVGPAFGRGQSVRSGATALA